MNQFFGERLEAINLKPLSEAAAATRENKQIGITHSTKKHLSS